MHRLALFALLALAAHADVSAQEGASREFQSLPGSSLLISGSTTIGASWHCSSSEVFATADLSAGSDDSTAGLPQIQEVSIRVPVSGLHCQSGAMDRAMRHALKADEDTTARVIVGSFTIRDTTAQPHEGAVTLSGTLRVAGVERNVLVQSTVIQSPNQSTVVRSTLPLSLTKFDIVPPGLIFGRVRARDAVTIEVKLRFPAPRAAPAPAPAKTSAPRHDTASVRRSTP